MFTWITAVLHRTGLLGVGLLMLLENIVPVIPSELILPMAGFEAANGAFDPVLAVIAGTVGSILGGTAWYALGHRLGLERMQRFAGRHGRWLTMTPAEICRADGWFRRWGPAAVLIGRALPGVRGVICIPAGIARMPLGPFLLWSSLGALAWSGMLVAAGYLLQTRYTQVEHWLNPVTAAFVGFAVLVYVVRWLRFKPERAG